MTTLREALYTALVAADVADGRIFDAGSITLDDVRPTGREVAPFVALAEGPEAERMTWGGDTQVVYLTAGAEKLSLAALDILQAQIINALDNVIVTTTTGDNVGPWLSEYGGKIGQDAPDVEFDSYARTLRFVAMPLRVLDDNTEPVASLKTMTAAAIPGVGTDPDIWTPSAVAPAIYWRRGRLVRLDLTHANAGMIEQTYEFKAHVFAPGRGVRRAYTELVVQMLLARDGFRLDLGGDYGSLLFENVLADSDIDPKLDGQVTLIARYFEPAAADLTAEIATINISANDGADDITLTDEE